MVIAIIGLLIAIALPNFFAMRKNQVLKNTVDNIVSFIKTAKSQTLASINSSEYGVHFETSKVVIFKGKTYSANAADNVSLDIISPASITSITLGGAPVGSGEIYFKKVSGEPNFAGTITVSTSDISKTISISSLGAITQN